VTKKDAEALRRVRVRQLFRERSSEQRTETGIMGFYGWLEKHHPELLPTGRDPYRHLKMDLKGLYKGYR
jgi:hypothetical protein